MKAHIPICEDTPKYDLWLKVILGGVLALTSILGIIFVFQDTEAAAALFGITLFDALLFKAVLPRRYQIFEDRLRILMGWPFAINIAISNIKEVKPAAGRKVLAYSGIRLATSTQYVVEIVRKKGMNIIISPSKFMFLEQLNQAKKVIDNPN
ncbi:PH domain-containing protein [Chloroflexota bacterium]